MSTKFLRVYLAGPINGCTDEECRDWRRYVADFLERSMTGERCTVFEVVDPMRRDYRGMEDEKAREIVELDKVDVAACDVVVASCPRPSVGTSMEVLKAWEASKLVVAVVPQGSPVSPWLRYHAHHLVERYRDAVDAVLEFADSLA